MTYSYKEAGIPNIWGHISEDNTSFSKEPVFNMETPTVEGAFYIGAITYHNVGSGDGVNNGVSNFYFDASRCSSIYKNDINTVQPPAMTVNYYIKAK